MLSAVKRKIESFSIFKNYKNNKFYSKFISQGDLCFDVGANMGDRTKAFLALGAKVVAIEPQKKCMESLKNKFTNNNLKIIDKALGEKRGTLEISICDEAPTISTMSENWKSKGRFSASYKWDRKEVVEVITLDDVINDYGLPVFCKIDVEGFELQVLKGLTKPIKHIPFEFTNEFISDTKIIMDKLNTIGKYKYNFSLEEDLELSLDNYLSSEELYQKLISFQNADLWGDIYAKLDL